MHCGSIDETKRVLRDDGSLFNLDYKGVSHKQREFLVSTPDILNIELNILAMKNKMVKLTFTPFVENCTQNKVHHSQCPGTTKCIHEDLFCDGVINCIETYFYS